MMKLNKKNLEYYILGFILLMGFAVRLYKINSPIADWHSFRQADTASVSLEYVKNGVNLFYPKYHDISRIQSGIFNPEGHRFVEFPIYNAIHALVAGTFTFFTLEVWGRLISIVSALGTAYILYLLGKKYISSLGGIIAAAFYALNPYNIYFTRVILPEPIAVLFAVWALYLFSKYHDTQKLVHFVYSAVLLSVSILIKPYTAFYGVPILFLLLEANSFKRIMKDKRNWIFGGIVLLPFIAWRIWISNYPEGIPFWKWTFNGDGIRFKPAYWFWILGERLTKLILGFGGVIPFYFGVISYQKKYKLIHTLMVGMLLFVLVIATANVRHDYYQSIAIPAISLMFSLGLIKLWDLENVNRNILRGSIVFLIFLMMITGAYQVKDYYKINHPEIMDAGAAVDRLTPKDSIVIAQYFGDTAFLYQTKRRGWPNVELPINELIEEGAEYYASVDLGSAQTKEFMQKFKIMEITPTYVVLDLRQKSQ